MINEVIHRIGKATAERLIAKHGDDYAEAFADLLSCVYSTGVAGANEALSIASACSAWGHYLKHYTEREGKRKDGAAMLTAILASRDPDPETSN